MNGKVLFVKLSETLGFGSSKRVEQMSQWGQSSKMAGFFYTFLWEDFSDDRDNIMYINILIM